MRRRDDSGPGFLLLVTLFVGAQLLGRCATSADAQAPIPACAWTPAARDTLVRMVLVETESEPERVTIAHVLARRWAARGPARATETFERSIVAFSSVLRRLDAALLEPLPLVDAARVAGRSPHQRHSLASTAATRRDVAEVLDAWARGDLPGDGCAWDARGPAFNWRAPRPADAQNRTLLDCPGFNAYTPPSPAQLALLAHPRGCNGLPPP